MIKRILVGAILVALPAVVSAQQSDRVRVQIASRGLAGALFASPQPYFEGGPLANMYLPSGTDARTRDGRPIVGFQFTGWTEGDATRGQVFALVAADGSTEGDLRYRADLLERREFASYRLRPGETVPITEMLSLGLEPMIVKAESMRDIVAQLEQMRQSLQQR